MKTLNILPILLLGATLFTACKKQDATTISPVASMATDYAYSSSVIYQLSVKKSEPSSILVWDDGYMHISGLVFNAMLTTGSDINATRTTTDGASVANPTPGPERFGTQVDKTFQFFSDMLGAGKIPPLNCPMASASLQAGPGGNAMALVINGRYNYTPDMPMTPPPHVQFIVNEPFEINSEWKNNVNITDAGINIMLEMDLGRLAAGIDYSMMNQAAMTGGVIVISATSNTDLYKIMLTNLKNMTLKMDYNLNMSVSTATNQ